eukprot:TRINITY_DN433_c0_g3_i1.p1 TRINITY_DN433_c0_g3~~TRINITY_DN433_c0_g3_i1.p1  ORF type:complete len:922 (+),score=359.00 TRINITY_DN433_c0_g3_i1:75-2840(+)
MSKEADIQIGTRAVCRGGLCTVKYHGPLHHAVGLWVGVEFDEPSAGRNNGTTGGKRYFEGKDNHCLFVRPGNLSVATSAGYKSAFSQMIVFDAANEGEFLKSNEVATTTASMLASKEQQSDLVKPSAPAGDAAQKLNFTFEEDGSLSLDTVQNLVRHYRTDKPTPLDSYYVLEILDRASKIYQQKVATAVHHISVPQNGNLVVCGDTHGQLEDLLWIFFKHGPPSPDRLYLMNGDIADRGECALEIFMVLLAYKIHRPNCVWINKGNHEDNLMNLRYGFKQEVKEKYPRDHRFIYAAFQKFFKLLPIATVIDKSVFVVHGGLSRKPVRLSVMDSIDHRKDVPDAPKGMQDIIYYDSLWSDPQPANGVATNARGGDTIAWGPDVSQKFLQLNQLSLIIRSHQVPEVMDEEGFPRGFSWHHPFPADSKVKQLCETQPGMCLTVFSASNYCGHSANMGGVIVFINGTDNFEILEHYAQDIAYLNDAEKETLDATEQVRSIASMERQSREKMLAASAGLLKSQAMQELKSMFVRKKHELFEWFWAIDQDKDLHLRPELWREGCASVLTEDLPWQELQDTLQVVDKASGLVCYTAFLSRFQIRFSNKLGLHAGFRRAITDRCYEMLLMSDLSMRETFAVLDRNDDGLICLREFQEVLSSLGTGMTRPQVQALMKTIVAHGSHPGAGGKLKIEDFLSRIQLKYSSTHAKVATSSQSWVPQYLGNITKDAIHLMQQSKDASEMVLQSNTPMALLTEFFHSFDLNANGFLETEEFISALRRLPCCKDLTKEKLTEIAVYCDMDNNGRLNYLEFLHVFHAEDKSSTELSEDILEHVCRVIHFEFTGPMRRALYGLSKEDGCVSPEQFSEVLKTINNLNHPPPLSDSQIQCLAESLSLNSDGKIDFEDFLSSFEIVDVVFDELLGETPPEA